MSLAWTRRRCAGAGAGPSFSSTLCASRQACLPLEEVSASKREIACTRSFGSPVTELVDLVEAVSEFAGRAAEKLRKQDGYAGQVLVFIHTSPFRAQDKQYSRSITVPLRRSTCDTALIAGAAQRAQADLQARLPAGKGRRDAAGPAGQFG